MTSASQKCELIMASPVYPQTRRGTTPLDGSIPDESAGRFKVVVLGDDQCGKTSLLYSFVRRNYEERYEADNPVVFEEGISTVRFGTKVVELLLCDLSGCAEYDGFRCEMYRDTDLFLVCFDIGNPQSLENTQEIWIPEILREEPRTPFMLVGCKNDLRADSDLAIFHEVEDEVTTDEQISTEYANVSSAQKAFSSVPKQLAETIGNDWGGKEYIECCAKTGYQTSEVFRLAAQLLLPPLEATGSGAFKGLSKYARRKSSEITGMFSDKNFPSTASRRASRRKSIDVDYGGGVGVALEQTFLSLPIPVVYSKNGRRSSAFA